MASREVSRLVRKLGRLVNAMGGWIAVCVDCEFHNHRVWPEGGARFSAITHCAETWHTVRVLRLR